MITHDKSQPRNPWKVTFRDLQGRQRQQSFRTKRLAEDFEHQQADERRAFVSGLEMPKDHITFDRLCELYLAGYDAESKAWFEGMLAHSRKKFGPRMVRLIQPEDVQEWITTLERAPKTRKHILATMRQVLTRGVEWGYLPKSPARPSAVRGPSERSTKTDVFPFETWDEVLAVADQLELVQHQALVRFVAATGLRTEEALGLDWKHVDKRERLIRIEQVYTKQKLKRLGKNDEALRTVILTELAAVALDLMARPIDGTTPIFRTKRGGRVDLGSFRRNFWHDAVAAAKLSPRPPYQLRHTFATLALAQGCSLEWVGYQLGHADLNTTRKHYARFLPRTHELQRAMFDRMATADEAREETK